MKITEAVAIQELLQEELLVDLLCFLFSLLCYISSVSAREKKVYLLYNSYVCICTCYLIIAYIYKTLPIVLVNIRDASVLSTGRYIAYCTHT